MFQVYEVTPALTKNVVATFSTFEEAEAYALAMNPAHYVRDEAFAGCADFFAAGNVFAIGQA